MKGRLGDFDLVPANLLVVQALVDDLINVAAPAVSMRLHGQPPATRNIQAKPPDGSGNTIGWVGFQAKTPVFQAVKFIEPIMRLGAEVNTQDDLAEEHFQLRPDERSDLGEHFQGSRFGLVNENNLKSLLHGAGY